MNKQDSEYSSLLERRKKGGTNLLRGKRSTIRRPEDVFGRKKGKYLSQGEKKK